MVSIAEGEGVEDRAGNQTLSNEFGEITVNDGITPQLSVSLSGGSGTGTGDEGPEKLTKNQITIQVESDEDLQGSPRIMVVCSSLSWEKDNLNNDIDDFVANRDGPSQDEPGEEPDVTPKPPANTKAGNEDYRYTCGYDDDDNNFGRRLRSCQGSFTEPPGQRLGIHVDARRHTRRRFDHRSSVRS